MVAEKKRDTRAELVALPFEPAQASLGEVLATRSVVLAQTWRQIQFGDGRGGTPTIGQIDGIVESLLEEIGYSLDAGTDLPAAAWGRVAGLLRLSRHRGEQGLSDEFETLRDVVHAAAMQHGATPGERKRLNLLLDAAQAQARLLLRSRAGSGEHPAVRFCGVVAEVN